MCLLGYWNELYGSLSFPKKHLLAIADAFFLLFMWTFNICANRISLIELVND